MHYRVSIWKRLYLRVIWRFVSLVRFHLTGNCGNACAHVEPYGWVPEAGCPIHDTEERGTMKPKLDIFTIEHSDGQPRSVRARNFRVTREGALLFYSWPWVRVAAFAPGTWNGGVVRGVGPEVTQ